MPATPTSRSSAEATNQPRANAHAAAEGVRLRSLASADEYRAAVALQIETWGEESADIVPASLMQVAAHIGGLAVGAFSDDDVLLGFAFSLQGLRAGERVHWSHMLAVHRDARGAGIGRRIKEWQRAELARRGVDRLFWTFDPLQARNAHLNLNRLGVQVLEYVVNMYGSSASRLHHGMETDRLIVSWPTGGHATEHSTAITAEPLPILTPFPRPGDQRLDVGAATTVPTIALIEIPAELDEVAARSPSTATVWRAATRRHFQWALSHRCAITGLRRDPVATRAFYVITSTAMTGSTNAAQPQPSQ
jgi:predicted GNAT superfamily acetyltransferase